MHQKTRLSTIASLVIFILLSTLIIIFGPGIRWNYYRVYRGGDCAIAASHRRDALEKICLQISNFNAAKGNYPRNLAELEEFAGSLDQLLRVPRWSQNATYEINFDALHGDTIEIIISDPGLYWPPMTPPSSVKVSADYLEHLDYRPVLLNDGDARPLPYLQERIGKLKN